MALSSRSWTSGNTTGCRRQSINRGVALQVVNLMENLVDAEDIRATGRGGGGEMGCTVAGTCSIGIQLELFATSAPLCTLLLGSCSLESSPLLQQKATYHDVEYVRDGGS